MGKKLTQDDFKKMPSYILSISVHSNGEAYGSSRAKAALEMLTFKDGSQGLAGGRLAFVGFDYDTIDWQNSTIERAGEE